MALFFLHALFGIVAGRKLDLAGKREVFEMLDPILHRRCISAQHVQAGAIGNDIDLYILAFGALIFDDVGGVI